MDEERYIFLLGIKEEKVSEGAEVFAVVVGRHSDAANLLIDFVDVHCVSFLAIHNLLIIIMKSKPSSLVVISRVVSDEFCNLNSFFILKGLKHFKVLISFWKCKCKC